MTTGDKAGAAVEPGTASKRFLTEMGTSWATRAAVKADDPPIKALLEPDKPDFVERLLPFRAHPTYLDAPDEMKRQLLTCGWLIYNERVVRVETDIVSPTCTDVVVGKLPGLRSQSARESAAQALVDEAYHTLLVVRACRLTRQQRGLLDLELPTISIVQRMRRMQASAEFAWQRDIIQLMCAVAVEMSISRYLSLLAHAEEIQAFNRVTTAAHRQDESHHADLFAAIARQAFAAADDKQREYIRRTLPLPWVWFDEGETSLWRAAVDYLGFAGGAAMLDDCVAQRAMDADVRVLNNARGFAEAVGIDHIPWHEIEAGTLAPLG